MLIPSCVPRFTLLIAFATFGVATLAGCGGDSNADAAEMTPVGAVPVRVAEVSRAEIGEPLRFAGVVRARQRAGLTFQVGGVLKERPVQLGQRVEAGQLLATLYNPELLPARDAAKARLAELQAQTAQAERDLQRSEQLFERGVVSTQQREQQRSRLEALQAGMASARASLRQTQQLQRETELRAPFAGSIEALEVEPGEFVSPGQMVMRLAAFDRHEVEVSVPARLLAGLETGQTLPVWNSLTGAESAGRIIDIGLGSSAGGSLYPLVVGLDGDVARSGDGVEVGLKASRLAQTSVPVSAIMRSPTGLAVFRVEQDRARRIAVEVSSLQGERAVLRGEALQVGDRVVYAGLTRLAEGDAVELLP
ncbi:RND family efflux transporter, MFP subunit [Halopseudomonas xinjiangensis]|uniref:RND family efflux transporter, MFP subunit n=1 Tax=Halopseudomonas xinjiangensis TaxID=487184 RepID=A0A1H1SD77_9GAMM|nr:efflux RND transporter periplasmic adaptor subunit [Halopseudomonas xinjiangensis]SDS45319.1 RND family efflux transporter, MFP subunit [Halopseudomonas xinjiangensis]